MDASLVLFSQSLVGTPLHQVLIRNHAEKKTNQTAAKSAIRKSNQSAAVNKMPTDVTFDVLSLPRSFFSEQKGSEILVNLKQTNSD